MFPSPPHTHTFPDAHWTIYFFDTLGNILAVFCQIDVCLTA